jgi:predicted nucleotidyltransferase
MNRVIALIEEHRGALRQLCQRYRVQRLEVFGSAATENAFDPHTSDLDFRVELQLLRRVVDRRAVDRQMSVLGSQGVSPVRRLADAGFRLTLTGLFERWGIAENVHPALRLCECPTQSSRRSWCSR